ncbi:hypothetical protein HO133_004737 [Letharia lupina]|uniref:Uncharacterized protein n=1 Tax=Letharia lupina TaxID=560253 RepID=A0A8H6FKV7_9LECA|nr:uncharacterized protein HO133_004737 [Letharia lupina]KAF6230395.1 hypothetical protein HO133_004737 [Letharia lupina]
MHSGAVYPQDFPKSGFNDYELLDRTLETMVTRKRLNVEAPRRSPAAGPLGVAKKVDLVIEPAAWKKHGTVIVVDYEAWIMNLWLLRTDIAGKGSLDPDYEPVVLLPKQWVKPGYGGDVKSIVGNRF